MRYIFDGEEYASKDEAPDLGSLECIKVEPGNVRSYQGLTSDESKLPTYDDLGAGSSANLYSTSGGLEKIMTYIKSQKAWFEV